MPDRIIDLIIGIKGKCLDKEESIRLEYDLSPAEYKGILAMQPGEPCNCNALSKNMGLSVSRGSRVVEKLIQNKYIEQKISNEDRRNVILKLAPKGTRVRKKIEATLNECERTIQKRLTNSEKKDTIKLFQKLGECL